MFEDGRMGGNGRTGLNGTRVDVNEESFDRRDSLTIWLLVVNYSCMYDLLRFEFLEQWQVE